MPNARKPALKIQFLADLNFSNILPEVPFEPSFLKVPVDKSRFHKRSKNSSLEREYKHKVHVQPPIGSTLDYIQPLLEQKKPRVEGAKVRISQKDKSLVRPEFSKRQFDSKATNFAEAVKRARSNKPWLVKSQLLSTFSPEVASKHVAAPSSSSSDEESVADDPVKRIKSEFTARPNDILRSHDITPSEVDSTFDILISPADSNIYQINVKNESLLDQNLHDSKIVSEEDMIRFVTKSNVKNIKYDVQNMEDKERGVFLVSKADGKATFVELESATLELELDVTVDKERENVEYDFEYLEDKEAVPPAA